MNKDLTVGKTSKVLIKFSIPLFISVVFQQFYNIADSIIAGKFAGEAALASVGASYPVTMVFMAVAMGVNIGACILIGRLFGAQNYGKMKSAISTIMISSIVLALVLTVVGHYSSKSILLLLDTPESILENADLYLRIFVYGMLGMFIYNVCNGIFSALGDSKTPLYFLIFSSILNVVLDSVFVIVFKWGVFGVAIATFIAQGLSGVLAALALYFRLKKIKTEKFKYFSFRMLKNASFFALPSIFQQSFISIGNIFVQFIVNGYGDQVIAGFTSAMKLNTFVLTSISALASGLSTFVSQNAGANKPQRIREGTKSALISGSIIALLFTAVYLVFQTPLVEMFVKEKSPLTVQTGTSFLWIVSPFYVVIMVKILLDSVLRGIGKMGKFMIDTFSDLILRVVLSFILSAKLGIMGVYISWPIGWIIGAMLAVVFYFQERKGKQLAV